MAQKLALQWSPEQISGWLKQQFPTDRDMRISHEAIYRSLFVQTRGVLKKELTAQLRTRRQMRHAKGAKAKNGQGHILDMVSIRELTRRGRGSCRSWPSGRRSSYRSKRHAHRDARRTPQSLYDARQASKEGHDDCGCRAR